MIGIDRTLRIVAMIVLTFGGKVTITSAALVGTADGLSLAIDTSGRVTSVSHSGKALASPAAGGFFIREHLRLSRANSTT